MSFPEDSNGFAIDDQYMFGRSGLLVKPIVTEGATETEIYLTDDQPYYNYFTADAIFASAKTGSKVKVSASLDTVPVYLRGGSIIARHDLIRRSAVTMLRDPISLVVALDSPGASASGELYLDDGDTYAYQKGEFSWRRFDLQRAPGASTLQLQNSDRFTAEELPTAVSLNAYSPTKNAWAEKMQLTTIKDVIVLGLSKQPTCVRASDSGKSLSFSWEDGIAASAGRKRSGKTASRLTIAQVDLKVAEQWHLTIEFESSAACDNPTAIDPLAQLQSDACPQNHYRCKNDGHIPSCLPISRVNDGLCDPECCDGSDEFDGKVSCPDTCAAVGAQHRKVLEETSRRTRVGAKIRAEYILFGQRAKATAEANVARITAEIGAYEQKEASLKKILEQTESRDQEEIQRKKASAVYLRLVDHQVAIKSLRQQRSNLESHLEELMAILTDLKGSYNPNYQDMAVKGAVKGFEEWQKTNGYVSDTDSASEEDQAAESATPASTANEETATDVIADDTLTMYETEDLLSLLDQSSGVVAYSNLESTASCALSINVMWLSLKDVIVFRLEDYLPQSVLPQYKAAISVLLDYMQHFGIIKKLDVTPSDGERADVAKARSLHSASVTELADSRRRLKDEQETLAKDWGQEWEWKKLEGTCIEKNTGEYVVELLRRSLLISEIGTHMSFAFSKKESRRPTMDI